MPETDRLVATGSRGRRTALAELSCAWLRSNSGVNSLNPGRAGPRRVMMFRLVSLRLGWTGLMLMSCRSCACSSSLTRAISRRGCVA